MSSHDKQSSNGYQQYKNNHESISKEENPETPPSSLSRALKILIIGVIVISVGSAIIIPVSITFAADKKTTVTPDASTTALSNTITISTTSGSTVTTSAINTTTGILPRGNITQQYNEGLMAYLACSNSMIIKISRAFFGVLSCVSCNCGYCSCAGMNIITRINTICTNVTSCPFYVNSTVLGNPCPGQLQTLVVTYYCS